MSPLENKLSLKIFGLVYPFEYDFKCHKYLVFSFRFCFYFDIYSVTINSDAGAPPTNLIFFS